MISIFSPSLVQKFKYEGVVFVFENYKIKKIVSSIPALYVGIIMFYLRYSQDNYSEIGTEIDRTIKDVGNINALAEGPKPNSEQINLGILKIVDYSLVKVGQPRTLENRTNGAQLLFKNRVVDYLKDFETWLTAVYSEQDAAVLEEINAYILSTTKQIIREQEFIKY